MNPKQGITTHTLAGGVDPRLAWGRRACRSWLALAGALRRLALPIPPRRPSVWAASGPGRSAVGQALHAKGCAFCAERAAAETRWEFWFFQELYGTFPWISRLNRANGFCRAHLAKLIRSGQQYRLSYVAQYLCEGFHRRLAALLQARGPRALGRARAALLPSEPCPACRDGDRHLEWFAREFVALLAEPGMQEELAASGPLCLDHLQFALSVAPGEIGALLLTIHRVRLLALRARLETDASGDAAAHVLHVLLGQP